MKRYSVFLFLIVFGVRVEAKVYKSSSRTQFVNAASKNEGQQKVMPASEKQRVVVAQTVTSQQLKQAKPVVVSQERNNGCYKCVGGSRVDSSFGPSFPYGSSYYRRRYYGSEYYGGRGGIGFGLGNGW